MLFASRNVTVIVSIKQLSRQCSFWSAPVGTNESEMLCQSKLDNSQLVVLLALLWSVVTSGSRN